jgi:hypothetical protein
MGDRVEHGVRVPGSAGSVPGAQGPPMSLRLAIGLNERQNKSR